MTVNEAVTLIDRIMASAPVPRDVHNQGIAALRLLLDAATPKPPAKDEVKS